MSDEINTLEDFENACSSHDLTYGYSDDGSWYRRGSAERDRITRAAAKFPREDVERIWNAIVDHKLVDGARQQFYWRWPQAVSSH